MGLWVWGLCEGGVGWEASLGKQEVKSAGGAD